MIFSLLIATVLAKETCKTTLVRTWVDSQPRVETTRLCVDDETRPTAQPEPGFLISETCLKKKKCEALAAADDIRGEVGTADVFNRRFKLCALREGRPEVIEFQWNGRWQPSDRCVFKKDHSFIDTMSLIGWGRFVDPRIVLKPPPSGRKASAGGNGARGRKR